jgi:hypothetical protein
MRNPFNVVKDYFYNILSYPFNYDYIIEQYNIIKTEIDEINSDDFDNDFDEKKDETILQATTRKLSRILSFADGSDDSDEETSESPSKKGRISVENKYYKKYIKYKTKYLQLKNI